jgi:arabinogalactan endo-1,4-beta-galactosidase
VSYTLVANDAGKHILSANTGNATQTITVPNNASVAFQTGAAITVVLQAVGNVAIANGAGVTMYLAGNSTAKSSITVNTYSMSTLLKIGTDTWIVSGTGAA